MQTPFSRAIDLKKWFMILFITYLDVTYDDFKFSVPQNDHPHHQASFFSKTNLEKGLLQSRNIYRHHVLVVIRDSIIPPGMVILVKNYGHHVVCPKYVHIF
jgi:hypothetical protein